MSSNNTAVGSEVNTAAVTKLNDHLAAATIITLAGGSNGTSMDDVAEDLVVVGNADAEDLQHQEGEDQEESVVVSAAYSNYQAVNNNSVLVAGSCDDPGVHVIVVEHVDEIRDYDHEEIDDGHA